MPLARCQGLFLLLRLALAGVGRGSLAPFWSLLERCRLPGTSGGVAAWVRATPQSFCCRNRDGQGRAALEAMGSSCIEWIGAGGREGGGDRRARDWRARDWRCDWDWDWPSGSGEWESAGGESGYEGGFRPQQKNKVTLGASGMGTGLAMRMALAVEKKKGGAGTPVCDNKGNQTLQ